jgi:hypothetical protein
MLPGDDDARRSPLRSVPRAAALEGALLPRCGRPTVAFQPTVPDGFAARAIASRLLPPGTEIGAHYTVIDVIGEGGMGVVYRGADRALARTVAITRSGGASAARPTSCGAGIIRTR